MLNEIKDASGVSTYEDQVRQTNKTLRKVNLEINA